MILKLEQDKSFQHRHLDDVERIFKVIRENGYYPTMSSCADIWEEYSDISAAGWLGLPPSDLELWDIIKHRVKLKSKIIR